jgi:hypothetical protein
MKHALVPLLLLSCVLFAQDKPAVEAPKPAADEKAAESKPKIPPINVRDEMIELIHQLKKEASVLNTPPSDPGDLGGTNGRIRTDIYIAKMKAKADAQNTLLQALVELAKLPVDSPLHLHSSQPPRKSP